MNTSPDSPNPTGMYASLMADMIAVRVNPGQSVELSQRFGFPGVDLRIAGRIGWIENFGADKLREKMDAAGVRAGYGSMLTRTLSARPDEWDNAMQQLPRIAGAAQTLGFTRAGVVVMPFDDGLDHAANRKRHLDRLTQAGPVLADHGISLGLEYVSPLSRRTDGAFSFIYNMADAMELIEASGQPNVGLMLDSFHWHCAEETEDDIAALPAERIVVVHVNDAPAGIPLEKLDVRERELPGVSGVIDLASFMRGLSRAGYAGPVTAEPTHPRWPDMQTENSVRQTADAVQRCVALAGSP